MDEGLKNPLFGPKDAKVLHRCIDGALSGRAVSLRITDRTMIDLALASFSGVAQTSTYREEGVETEFVLFDFRQRSPAKIVEEIQEKYPDRGSEFKKRHKGKIFVMVEPTWDGNTDFSQVASIAKWAPTIVIQTKELEEYEPPVQRMLGEYIRTTLRLGEQE